MTESADATRETEIPDPKREALARRSVVLIVLAILVAGALGVSAQEDPLQGNPFNGRVLLKDKLCMQCHSVWGHGGVVGPDLSSAVAGKTWLGLVGDFWNHTPRMIDAIGAKGYEWPKLDRGEMADILAYLYYLRLFDEPGNPQLGSVAFHRLRCSSCHMLGGEGGAGGGALDEFSSFASPVRLAQAMWNAGPAMQRMQLGRGASIPSFAGNEIAHIQAFIRSQALREDRGVGLLPLPDPRKGREVFENKRCGVCHRGSRGAGPDLATSSLHLTVSEISAILWNHSYAMFDRMQSAGISFPRFEESEMADLISYLHFIGFFSEDGDAAEGEAVFRDRGCAGCHAGDGAEAMDLASSDAISDPIALSAAMWNHAPEMHGLMADLAIVWPKFESGEMEDLAAYLSRLAAVKENSE